VLLRVFQLDFVPCPPSAGIGDPLALDRRRRWVSVSARRPSAAAVPQLPSPPSHADKLEAQPAAVALTLPVLPSAVSVLVSAALGFTPEIWKAKSLTALPSRPVVLPPLSFVLRSSSSSSSEGGISTHWHRRLFPRLSRGRPVRISVCAASPTVWLRQQRPRWCLIRCVTAGVINMAALTAPRRRGGTPDAPSVTPR